MNRLFSTVLFVLATAFAFIQAPAVSAQSKLQTISLIYSDHSPPDSGGVIFLKKEYLPKLQKELAPVGYALDIKFYHSETLFKVDEEVQACEDGLIDITLLSISYEKQQAPLHEIIEMPLMGFDEQSASRTWFELQETIPEFGAEIGKFKELMHLVALPAVFNMNKEARVPEDYKGLKIQASGMVADMLKAAGAEPVLLPPADWRTLINNKLLDGIVVGITGIPMYNVTDVVKVHIQPTGDSLGLNGFSFIMNRKKYESLPPEVQKVIDDNALWASERITQIEIDNIPKYMEVCKKAGNTFISLTPSEMMKWYVTIRPLHQQWIRRMEAMGLPGKKVYDEAKRLAKKYRKSN